MSLCRHAPSVGRPSARASSSVVCRAQPQQSRRHFLAAGGLALLGCGLPAAARQEEPAASPSDSPYSSSSSNSGATSISISFVSPAVTAKLRERDENMAWKCTGTMFDCSGEEAAAAQKAAEERAKSIRQFFDALNGEGGR